MTDPLTLDSALRIVRVLIANGLPRDDAVGNPAIPEQLRSQVRELLSREEMIVLRPASIITAESGRGDWLRRMDRSGWYYWPSLRDYLLNVKGWGAPAVRSLDESTDRILAEVSDPASERFDIRGLVLGYVQSGKTANFTALMAKAADVGFRLLVVLSGLDNGLRRQTQIRVNKELAGYADSRPGAVPLPPMGRQWHQFTTEDFDGDFRAGNANHSALQGTQPVLLVVKKNGPVLRRLHAWIDAAPEEVRRTLPLLVIDDEADQASVDTRGSYQTGTTSADDEDYEAPAVINGLIRQLLQKFQRCAYVAYTATPFANILIPHDTVDPSVGNDLYPKDFIVDLPKPSGYFGAEELFGRQDPETGELIGGIDAVRHIPDADLATLENGIVPPSLDRALLDFILAGAARAERGDGVHPATMLIHTSQRTDEHDRIWRQVDARFGELKDEWRYQREQGIRERMRERWQTEFVPVTRASFVGRERSFDQIEEHIGPFVEAVLVRQINSATGEMLDYEREPGLKAIAVGGNKLARGLTLEGLLISYFVRPSAMYDTLMQMGRWFGFRGGYEDLTRIWMPAELAGWFSDLANVEYSLREDIRRYEVEQVTPLQLGTRILEHPAMLVTNRLKSRFATTIIVEQSYSSQVVQTVKFPFRRPVDLAALLEENVLATRDMLGRLGTPTWLDSGPMWSNVSADEVLAYLATYQVDDEVRSLSLALLDSYIERQREQGELVRWTVAMMGRTSHDPRLGRLPWDIPGGIVNMISRSRLRGDPDSLGVITSPGDEAVGFTPEQLDQVTQLRQARGIGINPAAREIRDPSEGLLLIYPISRRSGQELVPGGARQSLFGDPNDPLARDVLGIALSFPRSMNAQSVRGTYAIGTAGWRPE
ncbi:Z1 domain-containing protein [Rhodanobacter glycinis]|uniref:Z1 domain-containing protein n=1 Tax=Rhodanobacter glycinis TaxID=582702 RepID=A0A1I4CUI4_9GAMM|nr:Z1 domain-containing protein [Rhodanobacter glycinis]SFK83887.1 Z1 domain-containing protein [Rhodanobacter glycinis]